MAQFLFCTEVGVWLNLTPSGGEALHSYSCLILQRRSQLEHLAAIAVVVKRGAVEKSTGSWVTTEAASSSRKRKHGGERRRQKTHKWPWNSDLAASGLTSNNGASVVAEGHWLKTGIRSELGAGLTCQLGDSCLFVYCRGEVSNNLGLLKGRDLWKWSSQGRRIDVDIGDAGTSFLSRWLSNVTSRCSAVARNNSVFQSTSNSIAACEGTRVPNLLHRWAQGF